MQVLSFPCLGGPGRKESPSRWGRAQADPFPGAAVKNSKCEEHGFRRAGPFPRGKALNLLGEEVGTIKDAKGVFWHL